MTHFSLNDWYQSQQGQKALKHEQALLKKWLMHHNINRFLQLEGTSNDNLATDSLVQQHIYCGLTPQPQITSIIGEIHALPIGTGEIETIYLPHVLECYCDPAAVLHEVYRVLQPEGGIVLMHFKKWFAQCGGWRLPNAFNLVSLRKMKRRLQLAGFADIKTLESHDLVLYWARKRQWATLKDRTTLWGAASWLGRTLAQPSMREKIDES